MIRLWRNALDCRDLSQPVAWARMNRIVKQWPPNPQIRQPYSGERPHVIIQGKSPVR
jgi:hypothetical protein